MYVNSEVFMVMIYFTPPVLYLCPLPNPTHFSLNMEAARSSKTLVPYHISTWHHNS